MDDTPLGPLVEGTRRATIHLAKAAFEVATAVGALVSGITQTVRPPSDDGSDDQGPVHVPVE